MSFSGGLPCSVIVSPIPKCKSTPQPSGDSDGEAVRGTFPFPPLVCSALKSPVSRQDHPSEAGASLSLLVFFRSGSRSFILSAQPVCFFPL